MPLPGDVHWQGAQQRLLLAGARDVVAAAALRPSTEERELGAAITWCIRLPGGNQHRQSAAEAPGRSRAFQDVWPWP